jgi:predicted RNA-binding protein
MAVSSSDFIKSAEIALSSDDVSEINARSAGSRAYYGVYHRAKEIVEEKVLATVKVDNAGSHESLIKTLHSIGTVNAKSVAEAMRSMKKFRHLCDYHLGGSVKAKHASMKVVEARLLMERLGRL